MVSASKAYKLSALISDVAEEVILRGDPDCLITGISPIQDSITGHITFLSNSLYRKYLLNTKASAVILSKEDAEHCPVTAVISTNPYFVYAKIAGYFVEENDVGKKIHETAVVGEECEIDPTASVGPHCVLGKKVKLAAHTILGPGCVLGDYVQVGAYTRLDAKVILYHRVKIGNRTRIASGVVIGSDGFGFANKDHVWHKVPQLGSVEIGNDVDIGANTTIDRGAVGNTIVEDGVKLDNLIQIGHNVQIGENTIIAGCVAISGSTHIGKNCMIGGATCFAGHITISDHTMITGMTAVTKSIRDPGIYSSGIVGAVPNHEFRKNNARFHRLENLIQRVKALESKLKRES